MKIDAAEKLLEGEWIFQDGDVIADQVCNKINELVRTHLQKVGNNDTSGDWEILYRDPDDGRFWERYYPHSEMHGGGPPALRCLTEEEAKSKYASVFRR